MAIGTAVTLTLFAHIGAKSVSASPILHERSSKPCTSFTMPVSITANNHIYDLVQVNSNIDAVHYAQDIDTWDSPSFPDRIIKNVTISKTYDIYATLCVPPQGSKKSLLQLASHGGGFDSRYWDAEVEPEKHSYVDAVLEEGYSILTYDRIGSGQSSKPDAYTDVQAPAEVEVLRAITEIVRDGKLSSYASNSVNFDKIIHVGHSYGSFVTYAFSSLYSNLSDALILTGFIYNKEITAGRTTSMDVFYAPEEDPKLFAGSSSGYIVPGTRSVIQSGFFSSRVNESTGIGGFEPKMLDYAYSIRQPITAPQIGSGVTLIESVPTAPEYTGPVQFILGEFDFLICLGDCRNTYNTTQVEAMYPKAKGVDIYFQPGTGHGMPFHNHARLGFKATFDWLAKNGF